MKKALHTQFKLKDFTPVKYFLRLEVARYHKEIITCQRKYALKVLSDVGLLGAKPSSFLMDQNLRLSKTDDTLLVDPLPYRILEGRSLYLTITRPNLAFLVQVLSQFMDQPKTLILLLLIMFCIILMEILDKDSSFPLTMIYNLRFFVILIRLLVVIHANLTFASFLVPT